MVPCVPMLIIFQQSLTGFNKILRDISPYRTSMSMDKVENDSQPSVTGFLDWRVNFHSPNFVLQNQGPATFKTLGSGLWNLSSADVYVYLPHACGQAPGKYVNHSLMLSGSRSGSSSSSGSLLVNSYSLRLWGKLRNVHLFQACCLGTT